MPEPDRTLRLNFHGRIIDHLGIQMYQSPVAAIAELVSNAWDADASHVSISLPESLDTGAEIVLEDDGVGMTFDECQERYLNVGYCRRGDAAEETSAAGRPILGRKGIGKFAGFGIAQKISVATVSGDTGEKTVFELDLGSLRADEYIKEGGDIDVVEYLSPAEERKVEHGTVVTLKELTLKRRPSPDSFRASMARRFLLLQWSEGFGVTVNGSALPDDLGLAGVQFSFPADYTEDERPEGLTVDSGWGVETLSNGKEIRWRMHFLTNPIEDEELRGIAVFAKVKLAQHPFFFNLTGGLGGQHGQEYMTGQVIANYIDQQDVDLIATERQRINWEDEQAIPLEEWGQERVRQLLRLWRDRRGAERQRQIEDRLTGFSERLDMLQRSEARTVKKALRKLGSIAALSDEQFEEMGEAIVISWEQGRLHDLIEDLSNREDVDADEFVGLLGETQIIAALNVAEAVRAKLDAVAGLKQRIEARELENQLRDYIAANPWLLSPELETFKKEVGVRTIVEDAARTAGFLEEDYRGRVDLVLSAGGQLVVLEFMRPGLRLNWDHLQRFERYTIIIREAIRANTGLDFTSVTGYVIADRMEGDAANRAKIEEMKSNGMYAMDWPSWVDRAVAQWRDYIRILATRAPEDARLRKLLGED